MIAKTFEIRDRATFIPILAVKLEPSNEADRYLLARAGYGTSANEQTRYIQLAQLSGGYGISICDPYQWNDRTYVVAHLHIRDHFDELESGAVVDVEHILGETDKPKVSESRDWKEVNPP